MAISRRTLLERLSAGALTVAAAPRIGAAAEAIRTGATAADRPIRLHRNENAHGPSRKALAAMRNAASSSSRYPETEAASLRRKIAALNGVPVDRVVLGCGSTEILQVAIHAYAGRGKVIVAARPTFERLGQLVHLAGSRMVDVPLRKDYSHDLDGMLARVGADTSLVYVCNPHNPTGTLTNRQDLDAFLRKLPTNVHIVIDEAYHDFVGHSADYRTLVDRTDDPRVIVTRSFSKIHGLAGLRIGYGIAAATTAATLRSHSSADNINLVSARGAEAALEDTNYVRTCVDRIADDRQEFLNQANARMLRSIDSLTNFVMLNAGRPSREIVEHFAKHRILVAGSLQGFENYIRVSLGTAAEMHEFWRVWDLIPGGHMMHM
jgi:histidinol-phosphate aminotransferase